LHELDLISLSFIAIRLILCFDNIRLYHIQFEIVWLRRSMIPISISMRRIANVFTTWVLNSWLVDASKTHLSILISKINIRRDLWS